MTTYSGTLAQVGYRARELKPAPGGYNPTREEADAMARECTSFLDQCAAEARAERWFPLTPFGTRKRSTVMARVYEAIAAHGPICALDIRPIIGHERSATEKAIRQLREDGRIVAVGKTHTGGLIYEVTDGS